MKKCFKFLISTLSIDCVPAKILNQWVARGIKTAVKDDPICSVMKLLKFHNFSDTAVVPYSATVAKVGLYDARVLFLREIKRKKFLAYFKRPIALDTFAETLLNVLFPKKTIVCSSQ